MTSNETPGEFALDDTRGATPVDERVVTTTEIRLNPDSAPDEGILTQVTVNEGVPTQVANPRRASWRTFVQSVIAFLVAANVALPIVQSFLVENVEGAQAVLGPIYAYIVIGVNFAVLVTSLGSKLIALLMANPTVNAWIEKHLAFLAPIKIEESPWADLPATGPGELGSGQR